VLFNTSTAGNETLAVVTAVEKVVVPDVSSVALVIVKSTPATAAVITIS